MTTVSIYALIDPRDQRCRYVGKTNGSIEKRLRGHLSDAIRRGGAIPRFRWINELTRLGLKPIAKTLEVVDCNDWQAAEQMWILEFRHRFNGLLNATDGGDGTAGAERSPEWRRKVSEAALARYQDPIERQKLGAAVKAALSRPEVRAKLCANAQLKLSDPVFMESLRERNRAIANSPERCAALSAAMTGRVITPEWRAKISASRRGQKHSEQTRAKMSATHVGSKHSEETKAKIAEGRRRYYANRAKDLP